MLLEGSENNALDGKNGEVVGEGKRKINNSGAGTKRM